MTDTINAIIKVGAGRGFLADSPVGTVIVTAAHCLPERAHCDCGSRLPPAEHGNLPIYRHYPQLLGPLGEVARTATALCLFVDPVADVAVFGQPDDEVIVLGGVALTGQREAYQNLIAGRPALSIGRSAQQHERVQLLGLDGQWRHCPASRERHHSVIADPATSAAERRGTSGSPIMTLDDGKAIGIITGQGPNGTTSGVYLMETLPMRLLRVELR